MEPKAKIRRFDVFATTEYVKNKINGIPEDISKGDAIWLAKVVASRKFRKSKFEPRKEALKGKKESTNRVYTEKWRSLSGIPQTDKLYDKEIIDRMGRDFYNSEFLPAIEKEVEAGNLYKNYRDSIREQWNKSI